MIMIDLLQGCVLFNNSKIESNRDAQHENVPNFSILCGKIKIHSYCHSYMTCTFCIIHEKGCLIYFILDKIKTTKGHI